MPEHSSGICLNRSPNHGKGASMKKTQKETNPFPYSDSNKRYYTMDYFMRQKFGKKACKIPIDGGFSCPNRDGTKGFGGCIFCSPSGSGEFTGSGCNISLQISQGAEMMRKKWPDALLIPYFQSFTNTYAPLSVLKEKYSEALSHPLSNGLCIATRPDCITSEIADYLRFLSQENFIMVELGLQTSSDKTAKLINRCHTTDEFIRGYNLLQGVFTCIHIINGLPGETHEDMMQTARFCASLRPDAIKIHMLYIAEGTPVAELYKQNRLNILSRDEYIQTVCDQLEILPMSTVIERVTGDAPGNTLLAPSWSKKKLEVHNEIDKLLFRRDSFQGIHCSL